MRGEKGAYRQKKRRGEKRETEGLFHNPDDVKAKGQRQSVDRSVRKRVTSRDAMHLKTMYTKKCI